MTNEAKIEEALSRSVCGGWDRSFLESILDQLSKARALSTKQKQTLGKVLARNTLEHQQKHNDWGSIYESDYKEAAYVLAEYHSRQPYYRPMAIDILAGFTPERSRFLKMYDNKYSKKVMSQYTAPPKYKVAQYITARAAFGSHTHCEFATDMTWANQHAIIQSFKKKGGFIIEVKREIHSAARGAKRYKLLPIGETIPFIVEERRIKSGTHK